MCHRRELETGALLAKDHRDLVEALTLLGADRFRRVEVYFEEGGEDPRGWTAMLTVATASTSIFMFGFEDQGSLIAILARVKFEVMSVYGLA